MQRNIQIVEKQEKTNGDRLKVNSVFHTIQGEGPFAGKPSIFVRLAGCNLQCPLCDTEYTERREKDISLLVDNIAEVGGEYETSLVVITGGEPFRQNIDPLVNKLLGLGYSVQIETNGTLFQELESFGHKELTIVCSPKSGKINKKLAPHIDAFKYVANVEALEGSLDGLPKHALEHPNAGGLARPPDDYKGDIFLQPVDEQDELKNARNLEAVVKSCLLYNYRLCLQIHKLIGVD